MCGPDAGKVIIAESDYSDCIASQQCRLKRLGHRFSLSCQKHIKTVAQLSIFKPVTQYRADDPHPGPSLSQTGIRTQKVEEEASKNN